MDALGLHLLFFWIGIGAGALVTWAALRNDEWKPR